MPPRGAKPKPSETKRRTGNPGGRSLNDREPTANAGAPERPEMLDETGQEAWEYLCRELAKLGLLATSDRAVMTRYCVAWSAAIRNELAARKYRGDVLVSQKNAVPFINPYAAAASMRWKQLASAEVEMGLTPSARSRVYAAPSTGDNKGKGRFFKVVG